MAPSTQAVQTFGKKKVCIEDLAGDSSHSTRLTINLFLQTATAVAHAKEGRGLIHINGSPISLLKTILT
ncbi:hypothetical protein NUW54_g13750 [Trametes sanguinea]|uniref:Uncharacterized protein n=1 Tax=Trametes sanguinea TaxID=158606 RepID=A0ACC1MHY9_9APHY|nr:hypothetical protein NUW54_g13750 [Trametes sanguinea]